MNLCAKVLKWALIAFNFGLFILGLVKLCLGCILKAYPGIQLLVYWFTWDHTFKQISHGISIVVIVFIGSGTILMISTVVGSYGAKKEIKLILIVFSVLLGTLLGADILAGVIASVFNNMVQVTLLGKLLFFFPAIPEVCAMVSTIFLLSYG